MRWLHISDVHVPDKGINVDEKALIEEFYKKLHLVLNEKPVDCIIFTGDLFNRGAWTNSQSKGAAEILHQIYEICSQNGKWDWDTTKPMDRLFYCPGNHDVLREAYLECNNKVLHRKNILQSISSISNDGLFCASGDTDTLLTKKTFGLFHDAMGNLCGSTSYTSDYEYQYRIFDVDCEKLQFRFVGINTALLAAQEFLVQDIEKELSESYADFQKHHAVLDTKSALDAYRKYAQAINKKLGNIKNDEGRLCFISEAAQKSIRNRLPPNCIPILFGHHPLSFLSEEANKQARLFTNNNGIHMYLCGHTHKPHGELVNNPFDDHFGKVKNTDLYQITVGGLFYDQGGYNETSFTIGEISQVSDGIHFFVHTWMMCKNMFENLHWIEAHEDEKIPTPKIEAIQPIVHQDESTRNNTSSAEESESNEKQYEKEAPEKGDEQTSLNGTTEKDCRKEWIDSLINTKEKDETNGRNEI